MVPGHCENGLLVLCNFVVDVVLEVQGGILPLR